MTSQNAVAIAEPHIRAGPMGGCGCGTPPPPSSRNPRAVHGHVAGAAQGHAAHSLHQGGTQVGRPDSIGETKGGGVGGSEGGTRGFSRCTGSITKSYGGGRARYVVDHTCPARSFACSLYNGTEVFLLLVSRRPGPVH